LGKLQGQLDESLQGLEHIPDRKKESISSTSCVEFSAARFTLAALPYRT
jgi:hypothetical protein